MKKRRTMESLIEEKKDHRKFAFFNKFGSSSKEFVH